jgi:hypothetical protein
MSETFSTDIIILTHCKVNVEYLVAIDGYEINDAGRGLQPRPKRLAASKTSKP